MGPNLSTVGSAQPVDFIAGAILDPQKEVKEGFMAVNVLTREGEEHQGYVRREGAESVVLHAPLVGKEIEIPRKEIQHIQESGSLMPKGLVDGLTVDEFCHLVKYLSELGKTAAEQP